MSVDNHHPRFRQFLPLVALGLVAFGVACGGSSPAQANNDAETIVFYGDSLTASYGLDPSQGYPALIDHKLDAEGLGSSFSVVSSAVSGETTAGGLNRLNWALKGLERSKQNVGLFMLALGANDGLRGQSTEAMAANLDAILKRVRERYPDAQLVVAGMLMPPNMGAQYRANFESAFAQVATANDAVLIPFLLENVAGNPTLNLPDGIHPNANGQAVIADNLWPVIAPILRERVAEQPDAG